MIINVTTKPSESQVPKVTRRGSYGETEVAILISNGFGAGWSTWNKEYENILLFHKDLVELTLSGTATEADYERVTLELLGDEYVYTGGCSDLSVVWLPEGTPFWVSEYDGSEGLRTVDSFDWSIA